jgi:hypothetical protein
MQTKQQTVHNFLNKQAQTAHRTVSPETGTAAPGVLVTAIQFIILAMPIALAFAGFCGAFDALVK